MKKLLFVLIGLFTWASVACAAVNINTATKTELESIKGIGPVKAQAIIDYRAAHGGFKSIDELDKVKGIGKGTLDKIRGDVSLSGNTAPAIARPSVTPAAVATPAKPPAPATIASPVKPASPASAVTAKPAAVAIPVTPAMGKKESAKSDAAIDKKAQDKKEDKSKKAEKKEDAKAKKKDTAKEKP